ncbi:MAG: hypothetical protein V7726_18330 [Pseudoalteromonas distincta]|uniref:hypothetical protein n=1 Tax=Pseudoalteromonas distincta TaxID=77608 RepID=UPI00300193DF
MDFVSSAIIGGALYDLVSSSVKLTASYIKAAFESPRVHRRPVCLSQATLPDSFKLS